MFKLFVYGFIPLGNHVISFEKMEDTGNGSTKYTEIFTLLAAFWAEAFYKHRQKKWMKIAKLLE